MALTPKKANKSLTAIFIFVLMGICLSSFCYGKSLYVIDSLTITVRTGPSTEHKIIGLLKTGEKVDVKEQSGDWSLVRYSGDQEGWVISRYLAEEPPSFLLVEKLKSEQKASAELIEKLKEENNALQGENKTTAAQLAETREDFDELREGAAGYLSLKKEYEGIRKRTEELIRSNEKLALENQVLKDITKIRWFLVGGGAVFGGWLIGFITGRLRRKKKPGLTFSLKE